MSRHVAMAKAGKAIFAASALTALLVSPALAGPVVEAAKRSEELLAAGKPLAAWEAVERAADAVWEKMPLRIAKALFVVGDPRGYGIFDPRENNVFKPGETIVVYAEPVGFGHRRVNGINEIDLDVGLIVRDKSGKTVASQGSFGQFRLRSRRRNREFFLKLTISLKGAPAGDYVLSFPITDKVKNRKTEFSLPFRIVAE